MKVKETRVEYRARIESEFNAYKQEAEKIRNNFETREADVLEGVELNELFVIIDADGDVYSDDITSLGELESKLEDILEGLAQKKEQEEYDDDSDYYRENFESIAENCACRAYEDLKDDWEIKHIFYYNDNFDSPIEEIYVNIEWLI